MRIAVVGTGSLGLIDELRISFMNLKRINLPGRLPSLGFTCFSIGR
jgi:hypothetical protein